jgi:opacity protein-like surface antigen
MLLKHFVRLGFFLLLFVSSTIQAYCLPFPWLLDYQPPGFYMSAFGGIAGGYDLKCDNFKTNRGYYFGVNGGKKIFPNIRMEGDLMWQGNEVKSDDSVGASQFTHVDGSINIASVMANAIFDFNFPFPGSPSIGGGVGYAWADGHWSADMTKTTGTLFKKQRIKSSFKENGFAWQIIVDLNFFVCNKLKINVEYRFFKLHDEIDSHKFGLSLVKFF